MTYRQKNEILIENSHNTAYPQYMKKVHGKQRLDIWKWVWKGRNKKKIKAMVKV